jgi:hypothetical protein
MSERENSDRKLDRVTYKTTLVQERDQSYLVSVNSSGIIERDKKSLSYLKHLHLIERKLVYKF